MTRFLFDPDRLTREHAINLGQRQNATGGLDRLVALKILAEEFDHDVKFALRFTREARTLAKLNHPNIVSVFEFGNVQNIYYF